MREREIYYRTRKSYLENRDLLFFTLCCFFGVLFLVPVSVVCCSLRGSNVSMGGRQWRDPQVLSRLHRCGGAPMKKKTCRFGNDFGVMRRIQHHFSNKYVFLVSCLPPSGCIFFDFDGRNFCVNVQHSGVY